MSEEKSKLRIHAQITPTESAAPPPSSTQRVRWRSIPHPAQRKGREPREKQKLTFGDRLLRNSALACALLLAILAMGNINQPWARSTSEAVERALTMHIDLDESIGSLSFVRNLMPESALVFLNLSGESELAVPVEGEVSHAYSESQPWLMFSCTIGTDVVAAADGTVIEAYSNPLYGNTIAIDHGGCILRYASLNTLQLVSVGQYVQQGEVISAAGTCASESELGAHLHLECYIDPNATDYCTLLK